MFEEVEKEISTVEQGTAVVHLHDTPNKRRKLDQEDHQDDEDLLEIPAPDFVMTESAGFVTGKGKAVPPPSKAAMEKALKIIAAVEEEKEDITTDEPIVMPPKAVSSFTTGSGNAVAAPSSAALAAVGKLFEDDEPPTSTQGLQHAAAFATPAKPSGCTTGSGAPATMMSEATRLKAMAIFGEDNPGTPTKPTSTMLPPTSTPFRPLVQHTTTPQRPTTSAEVAVPPATAFRTPLRTTTNTFPSQPTSTLSRMTKALKPIEIKTPAPHRRVGLGRTPTSTNRGKIKNSFSTPFKMPGKSSDSPLKSAAPLRTSGMASTSSALSRGPAPLPAKIVSVPVFDLANVPSERKNMKDAFLHPQYNAIDELKELGL
jgi:breast cancer 2 susceptibility protein